MADDGENIFTAQFIGDGNRLSRIAGIVLDDMMAGAYGALVLFLVGWFNHH